MLENSQLPQLPQEKSKFIEALISDLYTIPGVGAIVLGGSYACGTQTATSDLDIALYYSESAPFAIDEIRRVAGVISAVGVPVVTGFYEWGAWVNGGAWIQTAVGKVDFLYRNLEHVQRTIDEALQGIQRHDYAQQPAYGFYSVIYLAETQCCIPLYDPQGWIASLKQQVISYPPKLKERIIADSLWSAEFTLMHARSFAEKGDVYNTVGCFTRAANNLTQVLFALNEVYFMSDKRVMELISGFALKPENYVERLNTLLAQPGATSEALTHSYTQMAALWQEVKELCADYKPRW
ncbi:MAG: nucleotidyltransferase domain-containing protein [Caldilineaceae bacterium]